jgi:transcriptional regulator GlxA family with amidase domain
VDIAIVTFDGFNELDSFIALNVLNRVPDDRIRVTIATPSASVTSMNGLVAKQMATLEQACEADAVILGSGITTAENVEDPAVMNVLARLDPSRQLIAAQCSGVLMLARLGLLRGMPACTDTTTTPMVIAAGVEVLSQPFHAQGNVATAGGCLASQYLAGWLIARLHGKADAEGALRYVAPVGEKDEYVERVWRNIGPYLGGDTHGGVALAVHDTAATDQLAI